MTLEIYDCTPREGSQADGAHLSLANRIALAELLDDFGVDYIELGWPISDDVMKAFHELNGKLKKAKLTAFGSTSMSSNPSEDANLKALVESKAPYACIFGKTWLEHVERQLKLTPDENLKRIKESILFLKSKGMNVFYDAEHYFDGFKSNKEYAVKTLNEALNAGAERIILCDTNGGTLTNEVKEIVEKTTEMLVNCGFEREKIKCSLGAHFHDDCGLALANAIAVLPFVKQMQGTINGLGERIGNLNFSVFLPLYTLKMKQKHKVELLKIKKVNGKSFALFGLEIPERTPFVGDTAFAHKGGVHVNALERKASYEHIMPEEVGNKRRIILNTLGGRSAIISVAESLGYLIDKKNEDVKEKCQKLYGELKILEERGYKIGTLKAEQYLLIEKYFGKLNEFFSIKEWHVKSGKEGSSFEVIAEINGKIIEKSIAIEGGPVDAEFKALKGILHDSYPEIGELELVDFHMVIANLSGEASTVRNEVKFSDGEDFITVGVNSNLLGASLEALTKGFNYYLNKNKKSQDIKVENEERIVC
ncbi:MAG: alpha-isopropylmalate synthase regulatory domain-containing protein [Nanoarchaeota archaeon]